MSEISPLGSLSCLFLGLAVLVYSWRRVSLGLLLASLALGWSGDLYAPQALAGVAVLGLLVLACRRRAGWGFWGLGAMSLMLALHLWPGFHNPSLWGPALMMPGALPYELRLPLDKALAGLALLTCLPRRGCLPDFWPRLLPFLILTPALVLSLAVVQGFTHWAPGGRPEIPLFLVVNLLYTCAAEEAFFRGWLQEGLHRLFRRQPWGSPLAIVLPALLFGLAHLASGPRYAVLAAGAGLGYGWAYARTRRIEAPVLVHFALNAVHFLAFVYPAAVPAP